MDSRFNRSYRVCSRHGRAARKVFRTAPNLAVAEPTWSAKFVIDTDVDHLNVDAEMPRQDIDGRSAAEEIVSHLGGDCFGVSADAFLCDPVIRSKHKQNLAAEPGWNYPLNDRDPECELF